MFDMPLFNFFIFAIIFAIAGLISVILAFYYSSKLRKCEINQAETEHMDIMVIHRPKKANQWEKAVSIFKILALISFAVSLLSLTTFMYYDTTAKQYGAYDDFNKKESINIIKQNIANGFVDQSEELPDNLKGCIIIYFKYGCSDCERIHDDLLQYITDKNLQNIYFVSTRSEKGIALLEKYSVATVPSGIYIMMEPLSTIERYTEVLYNINAPDTAEHTFLSENMDKLIEYQSLKK